MRRIVTAALGILVLAGIVMPAQAAAHKYRSHVEIDGYACVYMRSGCFFNGHVSAHVAKCERHRIVKVFDPSGTFLGRDETNRDGDWTVEAEATEPGSYHAVVKRRKLPSGDVCKRARSLDFVFV